MSEKPKVGDLAELRYDYLQDRYRQRARELASKAQGIERLCYRIFGSDLMASIAFAIDPWARFRFPTVKISSANRVRQIEGISASKRTIGTIKKSTIRTVYYWPSSSVSVSITGPTTQETVLSSQERIPGFVKDTTRRTRVKDSDVGEFELFKPTLSSAPNSYSYEPQHTTALTTDVNYLTNVQNQTTFRTGPCFRIASYNVSGDAANCRLRANAAISKNALGMVSRCLPTSRKYNLFYQLAELKDVPRMVRDLCSVWKDFYLWVGPANFSGLIHGRYDDLHINRGELLQWAGRLGIKVDADVSVANLYLSIKFGWQSLLQTYNGIVSKPAQVAKQLNMLIQQNGAATNFRTKFSWQEVGSTPISYDFATVLEETPSWGESKAVRECELRCVVNATFKFPKVDVPALRSLYFRKLGLDVSPLDIYDLIPWTWLIDWFAGIHEYGQMMDALWNDSSLINYGFMTYKEISRNTMSVNLSYSGSTGDLVDGVWKNTNRWTSAIDISGVYTTRYQLRLGMPSVAGILTPTSSGLSDYQKSILGALISQFSAGSKPTPGRKA